MPFAPEPFAQALQALDHVVRDRPRQRSRGVRHRVGAEPRLRRRHDERLHRGLHGRARHEGRVGRRRLLRQPREDRQDPRAGRRTRSGSRITCRSIRSIASRRSQGVSAQAIEVVVEAGDSGPITPIGVNLPNDQRIREKYGSKSVSLSNVLDAYERSMPDSFRQEFAWDDAEVERAKRWGAFASELTTEIHEVLGHGSGRMADHITVHAAGSAEGAVLGARRDARRSGGALFRRRSVSRARSGSCRPTSSRPSSRPSTRRTRATRWCSCGGCAIGAQLEEDHMRNRQAIVHWLLANTRALDVRRRDEKTYFVVVDSDAFRDGVGDAAGRGAAHQVRRRLRGGEGAVRDLRRALRPRDARRGRRPRRSPEPAVVHRLRDAEAGAGDGRRRQDHRREDLVSLRPDHANARVLSSCNGD